MAEAREVDGCERLRRGAVRLGVDRCGAVAEAREVDGCERLRCGAVRLGVDRCGAVAEAREVERFRCGAFRLGLAVDLGDAVADSRPEGRVVSSTAALERAVRFLFSPPLASILSTLFNRSALSLLRLCLLLASLSLEVTRPTSARGCAGGAVDSAFLRFRRGSRVSDLADSPFVVVVSGDVC